MAWLRDNNLQLYMSMGVTGVTGSCPVGSTFICHLTARMMPWPGLGSYHYSLESTPKEDHLTLNIQYLFLLLVALRIIINWIRAKYKMLRRKISQHCSVSLSGSSGHWVFICGKSTRYWKGFRESSLAQIFIYLLINKFWWGGGGGEWGNGVKNTHNCSQVLF